MWEVYAGVFLLHLILENILHNESAFRRLMQIKYNCMDKKWFVHSEYDNMLKQIWSRKYRVESTNNSIKSNNKWWLKAKVCEQKNLTNERRVK